MISRRAVLAGLAGAGLAGAAPAGQARALDRQEPRGLAIESAPFASFSAGDRDRRQFGALTFLGGLELRSRDPEFGGLSGLV
ncbi:MAG: twin-arginine translocation pathway signal, partial [Rhabdaerophilum sp.]